MITLLQVFSLSKDIFELKEKLAESERLRKAAENELEALMTSKDEIKDVHELKKAKMSLEKQLEESKRQIEELKVIGLAACIARHYFS